VIEAVLLRGKSMRGSSRGESFMVVAQPVIKTLRARMESKGRDMCRDSYRMGA
jgi:hypothetical protein